VLVLGREDVLPFLAQIPVIPISAQIRDLSWEVCLSAEDGLPGDCVLKPEWIKTVDRASLGPWIATFPETRWEEVAKALLDVLGLKLLGHLGKES
jgi:mRNA-degrading endonuclease toxin of MazEF toxin-antitoxin module